MLNRIFQFLSSLRLTVVCLVLALVLVFIGTLAQVELGLYEAQSRFFRNWYVFWKPESWHLFGMKWSIPFLLPGGWLLGSVLLVNLVMAHIKRFKFSWKKSGIFLTHIGLIGLLLGQFFTEVYQVESGMRIEEGETTNYSVDEKDAELVFIDTSASATNKVYSIPASLLKPGELSDPLLPFKLNVKNFYLNSDLYNRGTAPSGENLQGNATKYEAQGADEVTQMDRLNLPSTTFEILANGKSLGTYLASVYLDEPVVSKKPVEPQTVTHEGKTYEVGLRFKRYYKPFTMTLLDFRFDRYVGTDKAKNFSSRIRIQNAATGEDREVLIYMNNPLRLNGETYFQASWNEETERGTVLQVVRNPAWLTPYIACSMVGAGLLVQFLIHLVGFAKRRGPKPDAPGTTKRTENKSPKSKSLDAEPVPAGNPSTKRRNK